LPKILALNCNLPNLFLLNTWDYRHEMPCPTQTYFLIPISPYRRQRPDPISPSLSQSCTEINAKWIKVLKVTPDALKLLEESIKDEPLKI
jgi:hypothetical protein